jgi:SM-20-related protein
MGVSCLDMRALGEVPLVTEPFCYIIVPGFVRPEALRSINDDYPDIAMPGSFPLSRLSYGPAFREFVNDLESVEFREAFEQKFKIDLAGKPTTVTVRGRCAAKDGQIHTDSRNKLITVLIYMNSRWEAPGGRLRLLRSGKNLEDMIAEIPPVEGTMLAFKRAENSWHGHRPFAGERRVIQFNWVASARDQRIVMLRHLASATAKRMVAALLPAQPRPKPRGELSAFSPFRSNSSPSTGPAKSV